MRAYTGFAVSVPSWSQIQWALRAGRLTRLIVQLSGYRAVAPSSAEAASLRSVAPDPCMPKTVGIVKGLFCRIPERREPRRAVGLHGAGALGGSHSGTRGAAPFQSIPSPRPKAPWSAGEGGYPSDHAPGVCRDLSASVNIDFGDFFNWASRCPSLPHTHTWYWGWFPPFPRIPRWWVFL